MAAFGEECGRLDNLAARMPGIWRDRLLLSAKLICLQDVVPDGKFLAEP
jgi:hypothetical protein